MPNQWWRSSPILGLTWDQDLKQKVTSPSKPRKLKMRYGLKVKDGRLVKWFGGQNLRARSNPVGLPFKKKPQSQ